MQKWCPESFDLEGGAVITGCGKDAPIFAAQSNPDKPAAEETNSGARFLKESGFSSDEALMSHLTREERATVFELVEIDVAERYEAKARNQAEEFHRENEELKQRFQAWGESLQQEFHRELREISESCLDVALGLAERIVRAHVNLDPEVLVRTLENTLYKVQAGSLLNITVNPSDAIWLRDQPELQAKLRIGTIAEDRRIKPGGCKVESRGQEWDATVEGQLATMGEMIEDRLVSLPATGPVPRASENLEPAEEPSGGSDAAPLD